MNLYALAFLRRFSRACFILLVMYGAPAHSAPNGTIAITFDDGFNVELDGEKAQAANAAILAALDQHQVRSMVFPSGAAITERNSLELVRQWGLNGHAIGNHTYQHAPLSESDTGQYIADLARAHNHLKNIPGWCPRVRFPFLDEGGNDEQHNQAMSWLAQHDYGVAAATILIPDWHWETQYLQLLEQPKQERVLYLVRDYIRQVLAQARAQDRNWTKQLKRRPTHVLLLHANYINAAILGDLMTALKADGWQIVDAHQALNDPVHQRSHTAIDGSVELLAPTPCH